MSEAEAETIGLAVRSAARRATVARKGDPAGRSSPSSRSASASPISICSSSMSGCRTSRRSSAAACSRTSPGSSTAMRSPTRRCWCSSAGSPNATAAISASCSALRCSRPPPRRAPWRATSSSWSSPGVAQAAGAALMTPTSIGLLLASFPPEQRAGAVRTWTAIGGLAAALGPLAGRRARYLRLALDLHRQRPDRYASR